MVLGCGAVGQNLLGYLLGLPFERLSRVHAGVHRFDGLSRSQVFKFNSLMLKSL